MKESAIFIVCFCIVAPVAVVVVFACIVFCKSFPVLGGIIVVGSIARLFVKKP